MKIKYVHQQEELDEFLREVKNYNSIALDLEFDKNLHRYGFNICLIQIQAGDVSYLIDPLSKKMDFKMVFSIFEDPDVEKIVFAFGEDLRLLNSLKCYPKNVYDLNIATRLLNYEPGSLSRYINEILELEVTKSAQLSNWFKRPLSEQQIKYAAGDVQFLADLKTVLEVKAQEKSISSWIQEENSAFDEMKYEIDYENSYLKTKDQKGLTEFKWHLLKKLLAYREGKAKKINKPSYQVIDIEFLKDIAHNKKILLDWDFQKGAHRSLKNIETKNDLIKLINDGEIESEKMDLSMTKWAHEKMSKDDYKDHMELKKRVDRFKKEIFKPIQKLIVRDYGEHSATFLLSNKLITDIVKSGLSQLPQYKKSLLNGYADELELDLDQFNL